MSERNTITVAHPNTDIFIWQHWQQEKEKIKQR